MRNGQREALVEALAGRLAHAARQTRIDVAEQIRAALRTAGITGGYVDASHLVGVLPPGVGGLPPDAGLVALTDTGGTALVDDDGDALTFGGYYASADHTHESTSLFHYRFSTNVTMADPGAGQFRLNTGLFTTASAMALDILTDNGVDVTAVLSSVVPDDMLYVQTEGSSANWARHRVSAAPTNHGGWFEIPIAPVASAGVLPTNNTPCLLQVTMGAAGGGGGGGGVDIATGDARWVNVTGDQMTGPLSFSAASAAPPAGQPGFSRDSFVGLFVRGVSGASGTDLVLANAAGSAALAVPNGTTDVTIYGNATVAGKAVAASPNAGNSLAWNANGFFVPAAPTTLPPSGPASGDLTGSYPSPQIAAGVIVDADVAAANKDGLVGVASLRTLGTGAQQAAAGDHVHQSTSTFYYRFSTNTTMADPGAGQFRVDAAVFTTSTAMALDTVTDNGTDITNVLSSLLAGDMLYIQTQASSANWARHRITGTPVNQGGWFQIGVEHVSSGGTLPTNNTPCVLQATLGSGGGGGGAVSSVDGRTGDVVLSDLYVDTTGDTMTGALTVPTSVTVTNGRLSLTGTNAGAAASLYRHATYGMVAWGVTGSNSDLTLLSGGGNIALRVPTGTADIAVQNALTVATKAVTASPDAGNSLVWNANGFYVPAVGIANPMTSLGDLITGGASGAPGRLGVGTADQVLAVVAGAPAWAAPAATASVLVNGGFEVWQRGTGPFTGDGTRGADRWENTQAAGTMSVSRDSANADVGSTYCAAVTLTGSPNCQLRQKMEDYVGLRGRTLTLSVRVRCATATAVRPMVWDSVNGYRYGSYHTGGGAYETLTLTLLIAAATTALYVGVHIGAATTVYVDNAVLVVGNAAPAYVPLHPADELARCQRYYYEVGGLDTVEWVVAAQAYTATNVIAVVRHPVEMALAPTVAVSAPGDWAVLNATGGYVACTALSAAAVTRRSARLSATVASGLVAGNASVLGANATTAARITFTANP